MFRVIATGEVLHRHELEDRFEVYLNGTFDPVNVCGHTFEAGRLLRTMDYHAFTGMLLEHVDMLEREGVWQEV